MPEPQQFDFSANGLYAPDTRSIVREEAARQGLDPNLAASVLERESGGKAYIISPKGAIGPMQLMPGTAADLGVDDPYDPVANARAGVTYLKQMVDRYNGDIPKALAAYNAGPGRVESGRPLPKETRDYVKALAPKGANDPFDFSDGGLYSDTAPAAPAGTPAPRTTPPPKGERPGFLTRSVFETATGTGASQVYDKLLPTLEKILPASMRGSYMTQLAEEVSKAGPEMVDFLTSPTGIALTAAHFFPASAPFAAAADIFFGGKQALQAVPDSIDAIRHLDDPHKVGRAIVDVLGAYAGLKGGSRMAGALRDVPADVAAGKPLVRAMADAYQRNAPVKEPMKGAELRGQLDAVDAEDRPDIIHQAEQPQNLREKVEQAVYRTPGVRAVANVLAPGIKKPPILDLGQELIDQRAGAIAVQRKHVRQLTDWIQSNVPAEEQNIRRLGFALEGDVPESDLSPQGREALRRIRDLNRERDEMLREAYGDDLLLRDPDTYIRHYWEFEDGGNQNVRLNGASRMMKDRSLQGREVGTLKFGMTPAEEGGLGLKPKYENVTDVIRRRHDEAVLSVENQRFANTLRDYGLLVDPTKINARQLQWRQAVDAPALERAVYSGTNEQGDVILRNKAPLVHPDIEMAVNAIFKQPSDFPGFGALDQLRALSKQLGVGFSVFHMNALSEVGQAQSVAAGGVKAPLRLLKSLAWFTDPEFIKGVRSSIWEVRGKVAPDAPPDVRLSREVVDPWLKANLSMSSAESEASAIKAAREFLANRGPLLKAVGAPVRMLGDAQYIFNRALFDYYLPGQMIHSAEHLYASELNRLGPNPTPEAMHGLRREISDHLNRAYGADNLQRLMLTPNTQRALGFALFAPMWTLSNLRVLAKGFETTTGSRLTTRYIAGAAFTYFLTAELANYAISGWYAKHYPEDKKAGAYWDEETQSWKRGAHWTWQNPGDPVKIGDTYVQVTDKTGLSDNFANIYLGQNPDGSQRYVQLGKAWREPLKWMIEPLKTLGSKLSLPLRQLFVQIGKHDPGSGFPVIDEKLRPKQQLEQRASEAAEMFTPFAAAGLKQKVEHAIDPHVFKEPGATTQLGGLPARKGASFYQVVADVREAQDAGRFDLIPQIMRNAALNGITAKAIEKEIGSRNRKEQRTAVGLPKPAAPATPTAPPLHFDFSSSGLYRQE